MYLHMQLWDKSSLNKNVKLVDYLGLYCRDLLWPLVSLFSLLL